MTTIMKPKKKILKILKNLKTGSPSRPSARGRTAQSQVKKAEIIQSVLVSQLLQGERSIGCCKPSLFVIEHIFIKM